MAKANVGHSCVYQREIDGRWFFDTDMNCDGLFTISDVGLWLEWVYFLPGDGLFWALMYASKIAIFLELTPDVYGGWVSGVLSAIGWIIVLGLWGLISD